MKVFVSYRYTDREGTGFGSAILTLDVSEVNEEVLKDVSENLKDHYNFKQVILLNIIKLPIK